MTDESATPDPQRLQRHLRALSAVNRQLQAQLEGGSVHVAGQSVVPGSDLLADMSAADAPWSPIVVRRASVGSRWLEQLRRQGTAGEPFLVHASTRGVFVVEGTVRREVTSGLLSAALSRALGPVRAVGDDEVDRWSEGAPVAVLEGGRGRPFVVVGGKRLSLHGLPLPHPVKNDEMLMFPVGQELQLGAGVRSGARRVERTRALVAEEGASRATSELLRKVARRVRRLGAGTK